MTRLRRLPYAVAVKKQPLDSWGRNLFTDEVGDGVAPSTFLRQVKSIIDDACHADAHAPFWDIE